MRNKSVGVGVVNTNSIVKDVTKFIILVIMMSEKRFIIFPNNVVWDNQLGEVVCRCILEGIGDAENVCQRLNEQQATIDEQKIIIEERDVANERLNRFLIEIGLEKEYIKWEFKKRCVE